ncbi:hypothetical protein Taro_024093 [Colocasia esculenta]|uniref:Uncharacterized protein n=1 Tax=Colocasia esculenta TaxID=4460 RepID=A0A843UZC1_COLES|nr:hypothetical protein [Colocasia esculenta]
MRMKKTKKEVAQMRKRVLAEGPLASTPGRLTGVSVQTWTPTLILASSDVDANFSGLHAQQSCKLLKQGSKPAIQGSIRRSTATEG